MNKAFSPKDNNIDCIWLSIIYKLMISGSLIEMTSVKNGSLLFGGFLFGASHVLCRLVTSFPQGFILTFEILFLHDFLWRFHFLDFIHDFVDVASTWVLIWLNFVLFEFYIGRLFQNRFIVVFLFFTLFFLHMNLAQWSQF